MGYPVSPSFIYILTMDGSLNDLTLFLYYRAKILYDRPTDNFRPITLAEKNQFLCKLNTKYDISIPRSLGSSNTLSPRRSGFVVSSTSWTEDEDFSILLNALQGKFTCKFILFMFLYKCAMIKGYTYIMFFIEYENACETSELNLPDLVCAITGKGPLKDFYMAIIDLKKWKHVTVKTPWLENEDYPKILGIAYNTRYLHILLLI